VVLDWDMPGYFGPDVVKAYRDWGGQAPILMLTGKAAIEDKERGFVCGADDYLTKPFHPKELTLRIVALTGRTARSAGQTVKYADLVLDIAKSRISAGDTQVNLTAREYDLLQFLIRHPEQSFTADALIERIWPSDSAVSAQAVRMCVLRVREKLAKVSSASITTAPGFGYKLESATTAK
jgi:DNA-binding response OmpR family regulator